jgi:hypothetical protein
MTRGRGRRCKKVLDELKGKQRVLEIERGSTRSRSVEKSLCKKLWIFRKTDCRLIGNVDTGKVLMYIQYTGPKFKALKSFPNYSLTSHADNFDVRRPNSFCHLIKFGKYRQKCVQETFLAAVSVLCLLHVKYDCRHIISECNHFETCG